MTDPRLALPSNATLAVFGSPIHHSQSPAIHAAAYQFLGLDWSYGRRELQAADLESTLGSLGEQWRGVSLTMPLKEEARRLATVVDPVADESGVVNTLLRVTGIGGRAAWAGFNTDVGGLASALTIAGLDVTRTVVLGAGATAVSAVLAARSLGASSVTVLARRVEAAQSLAEGFDGTASAGHMPLSVRGGDLYSSQDESPTLIISTLPGHGIEWERVNIMGAAPTFDVAYDPWPSPLAELTIAAGAEAYPGIGMLIEQALLQIRCFVNGDPSLSLENEAALRKVMHDAVRF